MDAQELALEDFKQLSELFRFYLGLVLQTVTFTLGVTGGVVAYVLKEDQSGLGSFGLSIPAALCFFMGVGFIRSISYAAQLRDRMIDLAKILDFKLVPHVSTLIGSLAFFGSLLVITGLLLPFVIVALRQ